MSRPGTVNTRKRSRLGDGQRGEVGRHVPSSQVDAEIPMYYSVYDIGGLRRLLWD